MPVTKPGLTRLKGVLAGGGILSFWLFLIQNMFATCALASQCRGSGVGGKYKRSRFV